MTELDLSLLTDEEQHAFKVWATDRGHLADEIQRALIAARAENKRLREFAEKVARKQLKAEARALLQSEKGGAQND